MENDAKLDAHWCWIYKSKISVEDDDRRLWRYEEDNKRKVG